ncbi:hypothetical protein [Desulfovermiculus halophilus]|jgi:general secretion pathway protein C|uniref:hypothetical protein n=1 Tax=Desulfovermiculus halophilus TaxID=339722 RepID=UPI000487F68C|nr:hypothetical protein [Desulfovermiculus halophilus]
MLVLGICLYFLTTAVNSWIGHELQPIPDTRFGTPPAGSREATGESGDQNTDAVDIQTIVQRNIFGGSPIEPAEGEGATSEMDLKDLPLAENIKQFRLIGTITTSEDNSWAIIEDTKNNRQELKTVGDRINDARITDIVRNNVIVNAGQEDAALSIDYKVRDRLQESSNQNSPSAAETENGQEETVALDREEIREAVSDLSGILEQADLSLHGKDGTSVGMQINNIQEGSFFDLLQLKNGDVLVRTKDAELTSPQGVLDLVQEVESADSVQLQIQRNGEEKTLLYRLR